MSTDPLRLTHVVTTIGTTDSTSLPPDTPWPTSGWQVAHAPLDWGQQVQLARVMQDEINKLAGINVVAEPTEADQLRADNAKLIEAMNQMSRRLVELQAEVDRLMGWFRFLGAYCSDSADDMRQTYGNTATDWAHGYYTEGIVDAALDGEPAPPRKEEA